MSIPFAEDAERGVLGCVLLDPVNSMAECAEKLPASPFYDLKHQTIFNAMLEMEDARVSIDLITLRQRLLDAGNLEKAGGISYLSGLPEAAASAHGIGEYIRIVTEKSVRRKIIAACAAATREAMDAEGTSDELLDGFEIDALAVGEAFVFAESKASVRSDVVDALGFFEDCHKRGGALAGLSTGYSDLDRLTGGLHAGELTVIAARPSCGKTSLAMNIAENIAVTHKIPCGVFSLEMTRGSLIQRMICSRAGVNHHKASRGEISADDMKTMGISAREISASKLWIDDAASLTLTRLKAKARRMVSRNGAKLIIIDYLQLLRLGKKTDSREREVAELSAGIKGMAKELKVPVILLAQLNREIEREKHRKPRLSDLRESGAIEQDADVVWMLYTTAEEDDRAKPNLPVNLIITKQRNGPLGEVSFLFRKEITRFCLASKIMPEDEE